MSPATLLAAAITLVISTLVVLLLLPFQRSVNAKRKASTKRLPLGEMGWPVVGSTFAFLRPHPAAALGDYMTQKISKYGRVFTARLFGRVSIVSADAELNRHVLNNETRLFESAWLPHLPRLIGKHSTVMSTGDAHKQKKSIILSFVSSARTQSFIRSIEQQAAALVASWKGRNVIYGVDEARKFSFYVISKKVMGMNSNNPKTDELSNAFMDLAKGFSSIPINLPGTTYYKALKGRAYIGKMVEQKMEEKSINERKGVDEEDDFVDWISKNTSYSTEEMIDSTQGLIFAGHHTTARTLSLAFYFLARCPKAIEQMREERDRCLKSKSENGGSNLTWDDYKDCEFTQNGEEARARVYLAGRLPLKNHVTGDLWSFGGDLRLQWDIVISYASLGTGKGSPRVSAERPETLRVDSRRVKQRPSIWSKLQSSDMLKERGNGNKSIRLCRSTTLLAINDFRG
ncbi:cytochrome P450 90B1-like [Ananas comosus]|uniref:Cytochrome P450 90B1-like n=1 Tax=Ananas comosus TaxID=4615 RepID=A0A6P5FEN7_ANACO|nr:cytochrome P450 90B1-like [Ananas comosus]